jgi:hypothetical protein
MLASNDYLENGDRLTVARCYNLPAYLMIEMLLLSPIIIAPCRDDQNILQMD